MVQYDTAPVECKEAEIEGIYNSISLVHYDDYSSRVGPRPAAGIHSGGALQPSRPSGDIVEAGEVDVSSSLYTEMLEPVQVV